MDGGAPQPSRVIISRRPVTVTASIPPAPPKQASKPNVVVKEIQSESRRPAQLQVQVRAAGHASPMSGRMNMSTAPSSPPPHTGPAHKMAALASSKQRPFQVPEARIKLEGLIAASAIPVVCRPN